MKVARDANTGYICISCNVGGTTVKDSRQNEDGQIRRRRKCKLCGFSFTTKEVPTNLVLTSDIEQLKLYRKQLLPALFKLADLADLLRAEHEPS